MQGLKLMSRKTSHGPVELVLLLIPMFFLAISLLMKSCCILLNTYFIKYHSCSASALAITFCERSYHILYHRGCIILCLSMLPLPAWFQQRFRKGRLGREV